MAHALMLAITVRALLLFVELTGLVLSPLLSTVECPRFAFSPAFVPLRLSRFS